MPAFSRLTALQSMSLSDNSISGTIGSEIFESSALRNFMAAGCELSGSIPPSLVSLAGLQLLAAGDNHLSGSLPDFPQNLQTLTLSGNRLSGTLPRSFFQSPSLRTALLNNLKLSGSLPTSNHSHIKALSLSRNYLQGSSDGLASTALATLVISANYMSCEAGRLEHALGLGEGTFAEPVNTALKQVGKQLEIELNVNPFQHVVVQTFPNVVLAYAGNPQLTTSSSWFSQTAPGKLRDEDEIVRGKRPLFAGYTRMWELVLLTLPVVFLIHAAVVVLAVAAKRNVNLASVAEYFRPQMERARGDLDPHVQMYRSTRPILVCLFVSGLSLVLLNLLSSNIYHGCSDPLMLTSIAPIVATTSYQWAWVVLNHLTTVTVLYMFFRLERDNPRARARKAHGSLCRTLEGFCHHPDFGTALHTWQANMHDSKYELRQWRRLFASCVLQVPLLCLASLPAVGYVVAQNVPQGGGIVYTLLGNAVFVAVVKQSFGAFVVPEAAKRIARIRHGVVGSVSPDSHQVISVYRTQAGITVTVEAVTILLAPMVAVYILDESCLRYYLQFSDDLLELLTTWGIGEQGLQAYRPQFCSRRLVLEFSYVWLSIILLDSFLRPAIRLLKERALYKRFAAAQHRFLRRLKCKPPVDRTLKEQTIFHADELQQVFASRLTIMLTFVVFGVLLPPLCLLAPLWGFLNFCALQWIAEDAHFEEVFARRILVHPPYGLFQALACLGNWGVSSFIFLDLEFELGPVVLYVALCVVEMALVLRLRCRMPRALAAAAAKRQAVASVLWQRKEPEVMKSSNVLWRRSWEDLESESCDISVHDNPVGPSGRDDDALSGKAECSTGTVMEMKRDRVEDIDAASDLSHTPIQKARLIMSRGYRGSGQDVEDDDELDAVLAL
eukprot:TRINITY_DN9538_c0_g1_i4.p1 TRINITY_DN9538_c0_g1~~TRINITY_DN9538_c0_g1_i4.p1  ORF type:complete len:894 (+),score=105.11 TRINITY_DN9538_c0_g1_i4:1970-4651(+)